MSRIFWFLIGAGVGALALFIYQKRSLISDVPAGIQIATGLSQAATGFQQLL